MDLFRYQLDIEGREKILYLRNERKEEENERKKERQKGRKKERKKKEKVIQGLHMVSGTQCPAWSD